MNQPILTTAHIFQMGGLKRSHQVEPPPPPATWSTWSFSWLKPVSWRAGNWVGVFGCFQKIGVPQIGWFIMENPIKIDDLGVPLFSETSFCSPETMRGFEKHQGESVKDFFCRGHVTSCWLSVFCLKNVDHGGYRKRLLNLKHVEQIKDIPRSWTIDDHVWLMTSDEKPKC